MPAPTSEDFERLRAELLAQSTASSILLQCLFLALMERKSLEKDEIETIFDRARMRFTQDKGPAWFGIAAELIDNWRRAIAASRFTQH
jgi:hypothetical protein